MSRLLLVLLVTLPAAAQTYRDDFAGYDDGADPVPAWSPEALGFVVRDGALDGDEGLCLWQTVPFARRVRFTCDLTVTALPRRDDGWHTAGIGLRVDDRNEWMLNLVLAPADVPVRRYLELHERLDGVWLAESVEGSRLEHLEGFGGDHPWQVGVTYRLEIELHADRVTGRVSEGDRVVGRFAWRLGGAVPQVVTGRPVLRANGLRARFDNSEATVTETAPEPTTDRDIPPWVSRDAPRIAEPTGYFRAVEVDGRWWLADPEGRAYFAVGTDHCRFDGHWCEALGYAPYGRNMRAQYDSVEAWAAETAERLDAWGFNTVAAGHGPEMRHRGLTHLLFASFGSRFAARDYLCEPIHWTGFPNVFSPDWPRFCRLLARQMARESRDDPWCLGTFLDNELEWYGKDGHLVNEAFRRGPDHEAKQALLAWLIDRYGDLDGINRALGTAYRSAPDFLAATELPPASDALTNVRDGFLRVIAERYFRVAYEAMREADPDHLVWGARFAGQAPVGILDIAGRYTDVFTINTYPRIDLATGRLHGVQQQFTEYYERVRKPFVITEWSFPALDSGLPCTAGAGMRVDTQAQKADCYAIFANAMADLPFMVGYHYFMWVDEPALGISSTFPEDSNYGLVNEQNVPYRELVERATVINRGAFDRHAGSRPYLEPPHEPSWRTVEVAGEPSEMAELVVEVAGARWRAAVGPGPLFGAVTAGDLPLGEVTIAMHQVIAGENQWVSADTVESIVRYGDAPVWDVVVALRGEGAPITAVDQAGVQAPRRTGPARYRAAVRLSGHAELPVVTVQPLWVESLDERPWLLEEVFVFSRPSIAGNPDNDVAGGPGVPNYYLPSAFWTDPAAGGAFGAAVSGDSAWQLTFWKDEGGLFHPDTRLPVRQNLHQGQRVTVPEAPGAWLYALRNADRWRDLTAAALAGATLLRR